MNMKAAIEENIRRTGRHLFGIGGNPTFVYSIGNFYSGLPEFLLIGNVPMHLAGLTVNVASELQKANGRPFAEGLVDIDFSMPIKVRNCGPLAKSEFSIQAGQYFGTEDYPIMQILLPDKQGRYADDAGVEYPFNVVMP